MDADKEGFLRSTRSLIQVIGRAARNKNGQVIMYADNITESMKEAIDETDRRRKIQKRYNDDNGIIPETIIKEIRAPIKNFDDEIDVIDFKSKHTTRSELQKEIKRLESEMKAAAKAFEFEKAAELRDIIFELRAWNKTT